MPLQRHAQGHNEDQTIRVDTTPRFAGWQVRLLQRAIPFWPVVSRLTVCIGERLSSIRLVDSGIHAAQTFWCSVLMVPSMELTLDKPTPSVGQFAMSDWLFRT